MAKLKQDKRSQPTSPATRKSIDGLIEHAFADMLKLLQQHQSLTTRAVTPDEIAAYEQRAAMFTVSSSNFRIVVLVHYTPHNRLAAQQLQHLQTELEKDAQSYQDYVSELGNNLCGLVCRVLGADDFSTGMSTPSLLNIANSAMHLQRIQPFCEAHMGSFSGSSVLFCTTFSLFFNDKSSTDLVINIPTTTSADEGLGELEFF